MRLQSLLALLLLTSVSQAQIFGTNGSDTNPSIQGTDAPGDYVYDGANASKSDGQFDIIETRDQQKDNVFLGFEDAAIVDDIDHVRCRDTKGNIEFDGDGYNYFCYQDLRMTINEMRNEGFTEEEIWNWLTTAYVDDPQADAYYDAYQWAFEYVDF